MESQTVLPSWRVHPGNGPYLLLLHGFLCSRSLWKLNLDALAEVCQPVSVELYGHHESQAPTTPESYQPIGYVKVLEAIRQALGAERWFVFGYSLGGAIALRYALTHPNRVIGHGFTNSTSALADRQQLDLWIEGSHERADRIIAEGKTAIDRIGVHPRHAKHLPPAVYDALLADAESHTPIGIAHTMRYTTPSFSNRDQVVDNQRPALLVWGTREPRFRTYAEFAVDKMPMLTVQQLDVGHAVNAEAPGAFNAALSQFIRHCASP